MRGPANISEPGEFTITNDSPRRRPVGSIFVPGKADGKPGEVTTTLSPRQHLQARSSQDLTVKKATKAKGQASTPTGQASSQGQGQGS